MPRARNIKPGFYKNAELVECSVWARLIFPGLWMLADREGRMEDRPKQIKMELLPADAQDVEPLLAELEAHGFLVRYRNEEGRFIQISNFKKHQNPHFSEKQSAFKPPDSEKQSAFKEHDSGATPETPGEILLTPDSGLLIPDSLEKKEPSAPARKRSSPPDRPADVIEQVWTDWLRLRADKRAVVTKTVLTAAQAEADKAGLSFEAFLRIWCLRGTQGLQADWIKPAERDKAIATFRDREPAFVTERREKIHAMTGGRMGGGLQPIGEIVDVDATRLD